MNASGELLGQRNDDALGAAEVAEQKAVLLLRHLADELGAMGAQTGNDVLDLVDNHEDVVHPLNRHAPQRRGRVGDTGFEPVTSSV